jgi:hypothetical protein
MKIKKMSNSKVLREHILTKACTLFIRLCMSVSVAYPGIFFFWRGFHQIQLRTEDRENRDLGVAAPQSGVLEAAVILYKKFHFI